MKKTLKIGIAPREAIARHTRDIVAGRRRRTADDPDIWFTSVESFAKILSERRAKSNLSRTLRTMARYGLVRLEKGEGRKRRPVVTFERVELRLALAA